MIPEIPRKDAVPARKSIPIHSSRKRKRKAKSTRSRYNDAMMQETVQLLKKALTLSQEERVRAWKSIYAEQLLDHVEEYTRNMKNALKAA